MVTLSFLSFDVEGGSCHFDFVEVNENSTNFLANYIFLISVLHLRNRLGVLIEKCTWPFLCCPTFEKRDTGKPELVKTVTLVIR